MRNKALRVNRKAFRILRILFGKSIICIIAVFILSAQVSAAEKQIQILSISPAILPMALSPGKTRSFDITVRNITTNPLPVKVKMEDFNTDDENGNFRITGAQNSPLIQWTSIDKTDLLFEPESEQTIHLVVKLPQSIPFGGYFATLFFEPILASKSESSPVVSKIGALLLASVGSSDLNEKKIQVTNFSLGSLYEHGPLNLDMRVRNDSLFHISTKPYLVFKPFIGTEFAIPVEEKLIFPGKTRRWINTIPFNKYGIYLVRLDVSIGSGKQIHASKYLLVFPYGSIGKTIIIAIVVLLLITRRGRLKKALRSLLNKPQ